MDRCPCGSDESSPDSPDRPPNRPSGIPRPDRSQNISALPHSRGQIPCPYPGSRIPTRVPPYTGQPLYIPPGSPTQWPGMRANFTQEVRDFQFDPDFFDADRPLYQSTMVTGKSRGRRMVLQRSNKPDMAVNQPIPERPPRMRGANARSAPRAPICPAPRAQPRSQTPQVPRVQTRQTPRALSADPPLQQERSRPRIPAVQPVRSTGAIPRVPGVAMRVPLRSPASPDDSGRRRRICPASTSRRPAAQPVVRQAPPLDAAAQLRARQQAQSLGVSQQKRSRSKPYHDEYMGDFELMEKVVQQEDAIGVSSQRRPSGPYPNAANASYDEQFEEFEELLKDYGNEFPTTDRVPYMSPEGLAEFEQLESTSRMPPRGQSALPRPRGSQGLTLDDRQRRARQQARSLGVARQQPTRAAPSDRVPYMSPEGLREFEQLEQEAHLEAVEAPFDLQNLLGMPSVQLDVQALPQQGPREPSELRRFFQRQWDTNAAVVEQWQSQVGSSGHDQSSASQSGQWCPPECRGMR